MKKKNFSSPIVFMFALCMSSSIHGYHYFRLQRISSLYLKIITAGVKKLQGPGACFSKVPRAFWARKAIRQTPAFLFCKAGLLICCKGNKSKNNCKVSCLETPSFWRYKENYVTRNAPEKFRDFRETGPCFSKVPKLFGCHSSRDILATPRF